MPTIDLSTPPPPPEGTLEGLPRRVSLTLPELRGLAGAAGDAPLPFEAVEPAAGHPMESRLGETRDATDDRAFARALATLHDPTESLRRRGLLDGSAPDAGVAGALGLLATPAVAVDLDVVVRGARVRVWHRQRDRAVATLATTDGLVFELAWFDTDAWPGELARAVALPEDTPLGDSALPDLVDLPYELLDAGAEALGSGRADLLTTLVAHHSGASRDGSGSPLDDALVGQLVSGLVGETQGRLRALVADIDGGGDVVGVVSWALLADGWRVLSPHHDGTTRRVEVRRVAPSDLAATLAPVLAEVAR